MSEVTSKKNYNVWVQLNCRSDLPSEILYGRCGDMADDCSWGMGPVDVNLVPGHLPPGLADQARACRRDSSPEEPCVIVTGAHGMEIKLENFARYPVPSITRNTGFPLYDLDAGKIDSYVDEIDGTRKLLFVSWRQNPHADGLFQLMAALEFVQRLAKQKGCEGFVFCGACNNTRGRHDQIKVRENLKRRFHTVDLMQLFDHWLSVFGDGLPVTCICHGCSIVDSVLLSDTAALVDIEV